MVVVSGAAVVAAAAWESGVPVVWKALMGGPKVVPRLLRPRALGEVEGSWGLRVVDPLAEVTWFRVGIGYPGLGWAGTGFLVMVLGVCSLAASCWGVEPGVFGTDCPAGLCLAVGPGYAMPVVGTPGWVSWWRLFTGCPAFVAAVPLGSLPLPGIPWPIAPRFPGRSPGARSVRCWLRPGMPMRR